MAIAVEWATIKTLVAWETIGAALGGLENIEIEVIRLVQGLGVWLVAPMKAFTFLGSVEFYLLVMPAVYWCLDAEIGLQMGWMLLLRSGLSQALKLAFHRPRPYWLPAWSDWIHVWSHGADFAFPSGHAQHAASVWGLLASFSRQPWVRLAVVYLAFLIGVSRVYLGVHFPSDVVAGWLVGSLVLGAFLRWREPLRRKLAELNVSRQVAAAGLASAALLGINGLGLASLRGWDVPASWVLTALARTGEPILPLSLGNAFDIAGVLFGIGCGAAWLARSGGFRAAGSWAQRVARYPLGLVVLTILWFGLKAVLLGGESLLGWSLGMLRSAAVGVWVAAGAPLWFQRLGLAERQGSAAARRPT